MVYVCFREIGEVGIIVVSGNGYWVIVVNCNIDEICWMSCIQCFYCYGIVWILVILCFSIFFDYYGFVRDLGNCIQICIIGVVRYIWISCSIYLVDGNVDYFFYYCSVVNCSWVIYSISLEWCDVIVNSS